MCNDHYFCNESQGVRRQVRWDKCDTGIMSCISGKTMDRFQCTWVAMIGEIHMLIAEYLGNEFRQELASYIEMRGPIRVSPGVPSDHADQE